MVRFDVRGGKSDVFGGSCESVDSPEPSLLRGLAATDLNLAASAPDCVSVADACMRDLRRGAFGGSICDTLVPRTPLAPSAMSSLDGAGGVSIRLAVEAEALSLCGKLDLEATLGSPNVRPVSEFALSG